MILCISCRWIDNGYTPRTDGRKSLLTACIFFSVADANKHKGFICCPCDKCKNQKEYSTLKTIISACLSRGSCLAIIGGPSTES